MPLLAYCTLENVSEIKIPVYGVQQQRIFPISHQGVKCLLSHFNAATAVNNESLQDCALNFNRVLKDIFEQTAIIPFRFPTLVNEEQDISTYLQEHESELSLSLKRFRGMAQMEIHARSEDTNGSEQHQSGTTYLRERQRQLATMEKLFLDFRKALGPLVEEWRIRESADRVRCYVLIRRNVTEEFLKKTRTIELPAHVGVRITGPWPVSEFVSKT